MLFELLWDADTGIGLSPSRELGLAAFGERGDAFARFVALEELLLQLALEGQAALERHLPAGLHGALDAADGHRGPAGRTERARIVERGGAERVAVPVNDAVDKPERLRLFERQAL